jgi:hypothetical protein
VSGETTAPKQSLADFMSAHINTVKQRSDSPRRALPNKALEKLKI